jgi:hypothetical protein
MSSRLLVRGSADQKRDSHLPTFKHLLAATLRTWDHPLIPHHLSELLSLYPTSPAIGESEINGDDESTPSKRRRLRRRSEVPSVAESDLVAAAMEPLTDEERQNWPGWVELESDPVNLPLPFRTFKPVKL